MIRKIIIGFIGVSVALAASVFFITRGNALTLHEGEAQTLSYSFDETHDFGFDALYDPWVNEYDPLVSETISIKGAEFDKGVLMIQLDNAMSDSLDASRLLNITLTCNGLPYGAECHLDEVVELGIEIRLCEAQMEDYYDALHASGLAFSFMLLGVEQADFDQYHYNQFQTEDVSRVYVEYGKNPSTDMVINFHASYALNGVV